MAPWTSFCEIATQVEATSKRLEKAATLGGYFATLVDDDLKLACRYFAGTPFPLSDGRTVNVGGAALLRVLQEATGLEDTHLRERAVVLGDLGDVAREAWLESDETRENPPSVLSLHELDQWLNELAQTAGSIKKRTLILELIRTLSALEARFLVKMLSGDLRIGLKEGAVEDAVARAAEAGVGKVQWANMLLGDIGETALLARRGLLDTARMRLFHPLKFMLATPAADLTDIARQMPGTFAVEDKFDGIRAHAHVSCRDDTRQNEMLHGEVVGNCRVALFSRTLDEITGAFPELLAPLAALGHDVVLDGEVVPVMHADGETIAPFQLLQKRLGRKAPSAEIMAEIPVAFVVYDILYHGDGEVLNEPFSARRALIETLPMGETGTVRRARSVLFEDVAPLDDEFEAARARGNEGLMVKSPQSTYKPGRRGRDWLKIKRALATLDVVVTAVEVGNGRRAKLLSDYTFAVRASETDGTLLNVGKAYSGLTDAELAEMSEWFQAHTTQTFAHGKVRVVEPHIVIEVTFDRVQVSPRHKSGYALRFPRIVRLRPDKPVEQIDTLDTVARLAE